MKKIILTFAAIAVTTLASFAQSELTGNWTFKGQESISGKLYGNGSPTSVNIIYNGDIYTFEKVSANGDGTNTTISEKLNAGKAFETMTATKRKKVVTLKRDGNKTIENTILYNASEPTKIDRKVTDTWYIEDGQLILDRKDENMANGEVWESKATYTKAQ